MFISKNPFTQESYIEYPFLSQADLSEQIALAHLQADNQRGEASGMRAAHFNLLADLLDERQHGLAHIITEEMGKPIEQARAEIGKCAWLCRYYADQGPRMLEPSPYESEEGTKAMGLHQSLGVVLAIMPWNFPFWQLFRCAVPAILSGNTVLLKHAPNVPRCAIAMTDLFQEAGFAPGTLVNLFVDVDQVEQILSDERVSALSLTGSTRAGSSAASIASKNIKKVVLELGGSDPFVVLADADIEKAVDGAILGRFQNNGQSCIAAKRFIVHESLRDDFIQMLVDKTENLPIGDPLKSETQISCLARPDLSESLAKQVEASLQKGAKILFQSERPDNSSPSFFPPTILGNVALDSAAWTEELFGPVAPVVSFRDEEIAVKLANQTSYGLGASIWTSSREKAIELSRKIEAGNVFVNSIVKSDPRLPFGGIKQSGVGRELSKEGLLEFTNSKTVCLNF